MEALWNSVKTQAAELVSTTIETLNSNLEEVAKESDSFTPSVTEIQIQPTQTVYVLELKDAHYYVGITTDVDRRWREHLDGTASAWTKTYNPIKILETIPDAHKFDEIKYTLIYMDKYGTENVRGGPYVTQKLSDAVYESIMVIFDSADNKCTRCFRKGHFVSKCYAKTDAEGRRIP